MKMTRDILYPALGFVVGLIAGGTIVGLMEESGSTGNFDLLIVIVSVLLCTALGWVIAQELNKANFANQTTPYASPGSLTVNLLRTFGLVIIPNWILESLFGANIAIAYCFTLAAGFFAWGMYKKSVR